MEDSALEHYVQEKIQDEEMAQSVLNQLTSFGKELRQFVLEITTVEMLKSIKEEELIDFFNFPAESAQLLLSDFDNNWKEQLKQMFPIRHIKIIESLIKNRIFSEAQAQVKLQTQNLVANGLRNYERQKILTPAPQDLSEQEQLLNQLMTKVIPPSSSERLSQIIEKIFQEGVHTLLDLSENTDEDFQNFGLLKFEIVKLRKFLQEQVLQSIKQPEQENSDNNKNDDQGLFPKINLQEELKDSIPRPEEEKFKQQTALDFQNKTYEHVQESLKQVELISIRNCLDDLEKQNNEVYEQVCLQISVFNTQKKISGFEEYAKAEDWKIINDITNVLIEKDHHAGMALFYQLKQKYGQRIIDLKELQRRKLEACFQIQSNSAPQDCENLIELLLKYCSEDKFNEVKSILEKIIQKDFDFGYQLCQKLAFLSSEIDCLADGCSRQILFKELFEQQHPEPSIKQNFESLFRYLTSNHVSDAALHFRKLIPLYKGDISLFLQQIIKIEPKFQLYVTEDILFIERAPIQMKFLIQELFELVSSSVNIQEKDISRIKEIIELTFIENQEYYEALKPALKQRLPQFSDIFNLKSLKDKRIDSLNSLTAIFINQLDHKLTVEDFITLDASFKIEQVEQDLKKQFDETKTIDIQKMCLLLLDYIKKRQNFQRVLQIFSKNNNHFSLTSTILFTLLLKNANSNLKTLILMAASAFMPLPLISYDWEKFNNGQFPLIVNEELFYAFEKYKSVLCFKVSKNKNKLPKGCTSCINSVFLKNFELHSESEMKNGSVEIQFDYNFQKPMYVPVADIHGLLSLPLILKLAKLFDIFLIFSTNSTEDQQLVNQTQTFIKEFNPFAQIITILNDSTKQEKSFELFEQKLQKDNLRIVTYPYDQLLEQQKINMNEIIQSKIIEWTSEYKKYESSIEQRINSMTQYLSFLQGFERPNQSIIESFKLVSDFIHDIQKNSSNLHSESFLPLNFLFESLCELQVKLLSDQDTSSSTRAEQNSEMEKIEQKLKSMGKSDILDKLEQINRYHNYIGLTSVISKLIKGFLENEIKPLTEERTTLRSQLQKEELKDSDKECVIEQMKIISSLIENKWFSHEYVIRELYLYQRFCGENMKNYMELAQLQIDSAQPFELIDGNNLQFVQEVYHNLYDEFDKDQVLVVSVIGPQSSGKSLLLNFLFGTQFQSAAGRCTRGVYGSILTLKSDKIKCRYKQILLLDTEGIQSTESRDDRFDKRIVFYILCVSHVVLICNKGEMNKQMSEVIKLATDSIASVRQSIIKAPNVNIIMNMLAQINEQTLESTLLGLTDAILEMENAAKLRKLFQITRENVFMLPYAFNSYGKKEMVVNSPSYEFSSQLDPLKEKILKLALYSDETQTSNYNMYEWLKFANQFWIFSEQYKSLNDFKTLDQKRQDSKLLEKMNKILETDFELQKSQNIKNIISLVEQILKKFSINAKAEQLDIEAKQKIIETHNEIKMKIIDDFNKFCLDQAMPVEIREKRLNQLMKQVNHYKQEWFSLADKMILDFQDKKSKQVGDYRISEKLNKLLKIKENFSWDEAKHEFDKITQNIEIDIKNLLKSPIDIEEEVFSQIHSIFEVQIQNNQLSIVTEKKFLSDYLHIGESSYFETQIKDKPLLFYIGNEIMKNSEKIIEFQNRQKKYLCIPNYFERMNCSTFFLWGKLVCERFNFYKLSRDLSQQLCQYHVNFAGIIWRKSPNYRIIQEIITQIQIECQLFSIAPTQVFNQELQSIEVTLLRFAHDDSLFKDQEKIKRTVEEYLVDMRYNIRRYFEFKEKQGTSNKQQDCLYFYYKEVIQYTNGRLAHKKEYISYRKTDYLVKKQINQGEEREGEQSIEQTSKSIKISSYLNSKGIGEQVYKYLTELALENSRVQTASPSTIAASKFFQNELSWKKIIRDIEQAVISSFKIDGKVEQNETIASLVAEIKDLNKKEFRNPLCRYSRQIIQGIVKSLKQIVSTIDEELIPFCFHLSELGVSLINLIAQTFVNALEYHQERRSQLNPLTIFRQSQHLQESLFIAKLMSNDKEMDQAIAKKSAKEILTKILKEYQVQEIDSFRNIIKATRGKFQQLHVTQVIENTAIGAAGSREFQDRLGIDINQLVLFYVDPKRILIEKFQSQWESISEQEILNSNTKFSKAICQSLDLLTSYLSNFLKCLSYQQSCTVSASLFILKNDDERENLSSSILKDLTQKSLTRYFLSVLSGTWSVDTILKVDGTEIIITPNQNLPSSQDIGISLDRSIINSFSSILDEERISNIDTYLKLVLEELLEAKQIKYKISDHELIGDLYQILKGELLGCEEHCPMCRRQCDIPHSENEPIPDRIHECREGHQLQSFGGSRHSQTNIALTLCCNELKDNDQVLYKEQSLKWANFKAKFTKWNFETKTRAQISMIKEKNVTIWNFIGDRVCKYYQEVLKIPIEFQIAQDYAQMMHSLRVGYFLLLDQSRSMDSKEINGKSKWQNLIASVSSFIKSLEGKLLLKVNSNITIITYSSVAHIVCKDEIPNMSILDKIGQPSGSTNFSAPLQLLQEEIMLKQNKYEKFIVCFMSDGESSYPNLEIKKIQSNNAIMSKLEFTSIAYGDSSDIQKVLEPMAVALKGRMKTVIEPQQLTNAFIQLIPQVYEN